MPWTLYRSTDPSAPVLTGQVGKLPDLLRACLVAGYGSGINAKLAAGWVEPFTGTNRAVFRPAAATLSRQFYRVGQNAEDGDASICRLQGFDSMSSVDAGSGPFPSSLPVYPRASAANNATAREWIVAADDRTCILFVKNGAGGFPTRWQVTYFGEIFSFVPNDAFAGAVFGSWDGGGDTCSISLKKGDSGWSNVGTGAKMIARNYDGAPGAVNLGVSCFQPMMKPQSSQYGVACVGRSATANPADGKAWLGQILLVSTATANCVRGVLRGLTHPLVALDAFSDGDTITDDQGRGHVYLKTRTRDWNDSSTEFASALFLETTSPPHS